MFQIKYPYSVVSHKNKQYDKEANRAMSFHLNMIQNSIPVNITVKATFLKMNLVEVSFHITQLN